METLYPIMMKVAGRTVVVVGGGRVAERKASSLLSAGAKLRIISPRFTKKIEDWVRDGLAEAERRTFKPGDAEGACLLMAATDDEQVNRLAAEDAKRYGVPVNVADSAERSSFLVPSVVRRGRLVLAVSTTGASPGAAKRISQRLEEEYGPEYEDYIELLAEFRLLVQRYIQDSEKRRALFSGILELDLLKEIREGRLELIRQAMRQGLSDRPESFTMKQLTLN